MNIFKSLSLLAVTAAIALPAALPAVASAHDFWDRDGYARPYDGGGYGYYAGYHRDGDWRREAWRREQARREYWWRAHHDWRDGRAWDEWREHHRDHDDWRRW